MAERRMFTRKVTDDDNFMALSSSAQALYLHLSLSADDDGFCNQVSVAMFKAHASVQDLQALLEKRYVYQFENGVIVIKHWRMANALRKDRYTPTAFQEELAKLELKTNGAYTMIEADKLPAIAESNDTPRQRAYKNSSLPYSFDYKMRQAFYGRKCPICGREMRRGIDEDGIPYDNTIPTIQHNTPLSKGGEHELGNISVICRQCNSTIQDKVTGELNSQEVIDEWEKISGCRLVATCLPQNKEEESSIEEKSIRENIPAPAKKPPAERHKYGEYGWVLLTDEQRDRLIADYGQAEFDRALRYVDESAQSSHNRNKWSDWNLVMRRACREKWGLKQGYGGNRPLRNEPDPNNYDYSGIENEIWKDVLKGEKA